MSSLPRKPIRLVVSVTSLLLNAAAGPALADADASPVSGNVVYTGEFLGNRSGGLRKGSAYLDNLDLTLAVDAEALWGWTGTELFVYGLYNNGTPFSENIVGDFQIVSNIETGVRAWRLFEAWARFRIGERSEMLVGLFDVNSQFDVLDASQLFVGSAHGIGSDISQAGVNGPSIFPVSGLALKLERELSDQWRIRGAIVDGVPGDPKDPGATEIRLSSSEGALLISELERSTARSRVLAGVWGYSAKFSEDPLDLGLESAGKRRGNSGVYLRGETVLVDNGPTASVFGRVGYANGDFNLFSFFLSAGISGRGFVPGRHDDRLGLAFAWVETSGNVKDLASAVGQDVDSREIKIELTYRAPVGRRFAIQPSLQYIVNPGIDPALDNATVIGLRFEAALLR